MTFPSTSQPCQQMQVIGVLAEQKSRTILHTIVVFCFWFFCYIFFFINKNKALDIVRKGHNFTFYETSILNNREKSFHVLLCIFFFALDYIP